MTRKAKIYITIFVILPVMLVINFAGSSLLVGHAIYSQIDKCDSKEECTEEGLLYTDDVEIEIEGEVLQKNIQYLDIFLIKAKLITHYGLFFWWANEKNDYRVLYIDTNKNVSFDNNITHYLSYMEGSDVAPGYCCTFQRVFKVGETAIVNIYEYYPPVEKDNYHSVIATLKVKIK